MQNTNAIELKALRKEFKVNGGKFVAVDGISFTVKEGEIFGLLGPNGAGKTTTISMLTTILSKTSGSVKICGFDVVREKEKVRELIGIIFQDPSLDDELTARENLDFHARLYGVKEDKKSIIEDVLRLVELEEYADRQVKTFSGGMKRRLEIARGFIHHPKVLFLDEPTIGLDPQTRRKIWSYITRLNKEKNLSIILTTHYMEEADELCDRIAIIDHGKIIKMGTPEGLKSSFGGDVIRIGTKEKKELHTLLKKVSGIKNIKESETGIEISGNDGSRLMPIIAKAANKNKLEIDYMTVKRPTLEDVFIGLTGRDIRDESASSKDVLRAFTRGRHR
jgi:daunorubicin resistance ABC transporter ATP-binding subunit